MHNFAEKALDFLESEAPFKIAFGVLLGFALVGAPMIADAFSGERSATVPHRASEGPMSTSTAEAARQRSRAWQEDQHCLAVAVFREARGEPIEGQHEVAKVLIKRAVSRFRGARSICDVVTAPRQVEGVEMFGLTVPGKELKAWRASQLVAEHAMLFSVPKRYAFDHYFAHDKVQPKWAEQMRCDRQIGGHTFCKSGK